MAASLNVIYSSLSPISPFKRKRKTLFIMPPTANEHPLPLHSAPKHSISISPSRRKLKIIASTLVFLALLIVGSLSYSRPIYFQRLPLSYSRLPIQNTSEEGYSPDPLHPLSSLGPEADQVYKLGSLSPAYYRTSLETFITATFPSHLQSRLKRQLHQYLDESSTTLPELPKIIWQTFDIFPETPDVRSWKEVNRDYDYRFLYDEDVEKWIKRNFKGSLIEKMWNMLPHIILKSDLLRYLLLYVEGGIYSDVDTVCLKPIDQWGQSPDVRGQLKGGDRPAAILGVEADVGDRKDWHDWWSRPLQISQWTLAFSPGHPILLDAIERIYQKTMEYGDSSNGPVSERQILPLVLEWTGPAVFTDSALQFLQIQDGLRWIDLRDLERPLRLGAITILPVTGFSPGVGNFNAKSPNHPQAMVEHKFKGSWKPKGSTSNFLP